MKFPAIFAMVFAMGVVLLPLTAHAQDDEVEIPNPESITLKTKDFVQLQCTFYPGGFRKSGDEVQQIEGKEVAPVVLVHGWGQKRQDLSYLGKGLQMYGHAVLVPDLRGHGRSLKRVAPNGNEIELDAEKFRRQDIALMVEDLKACKRYLLDLNNEGKLNIEMLSVVAGDVGALVALNWAAYDWSLPQLPTIKQGHDIKAFVLLTPPMSFKGATAQAALRNPAVAIRLDGLVIVGARDSDGRSDAKRIYEQLERRRKNLDEKNLFMMKPDTSLSGIAMIPARGLGVGTTIAKFLNARIVRKADDYPWRDRTNPLGR